MLGYQPSGPVPPVQPNPATGSPFTLLIACPVVLFGSSSAIGHVPTATLMKYAADTFDRHGTGASLACRQICGFAAMET
ncbi:hypothetical protein [Streptomyces enissocaesilis]|uniref:Uncharacterized protein n=1 Tax=Streptomyces enissocaesilis TaxID=332589 RepID=A0ABN3X496_9ACTN